MGNIDTKEKNILERLAQNDILIRNIDASYLYWKIKDDEAIAEYESKKKELSSTDNQEVQDRVQELSKRIFSFRTDIKLPEKITPATIDKSIICTKA